MTWTPPQQAGEPIVDDEAPVVVRRATRERPRKHRRSHGRTAWDHFRAMAPLMAIAVIAVGAAFVASTITAEPGPLTAQEQSTLAAKYEQIAAVANQKEGSLNAALAEFADGITDLQKAKTVFGQYYDAEKEYLDSLAAVDWRGARKEANAVMDAVRAELTVIAAARDATTQAQADDAVSAWPAKRNAVYDAITPLREVLGIPLATPTEPPTEEPQVLPSCTPAPPATAEPSGSPAVSGSPAPSGSLAASESPTPSATASETAAPAESAAASCIPDASATASASSSPSESGGASASASSGALPSASASASPK